MSAHLTAWELLAEAVAALPQPFGRQDVLRWFAANHPEVNPSTASAHLQFATSNAPLESRGVFASRTPLVTRVGRGEYVAYRPGADALGSPVVAEPVTMPPRAPRHAASGDFDIVLLLEPAQLSGAL